LGCYSTTTCPLAACRGGKKDEREKRREKGKENEIEERIGWKRMEGEGSDPHLSECMHRL